MDEQKQAEYLKRLEQVVREDNRFDMEAVFFALKGLEIASSYSGGKHVSAKNLLTVYEMLGWREFSFLAGEVFEKWRLKSGRDFGQIIWLLVENGLLGKQEGDKESDFDNGFSFDQYRTDMNKFKEVASLSMGIEDNPGA